MYSLIGINGNSLSIMSYVIDSMRKCHATKEEIENYKNEATSGSYEFLLRVSIKMLDRLNSLH